MLKYKAFYNGKTIIIENATSSYNAQQAAALLWKVKPKLQHKISVFLIEKDGQEVTHRFVD